MRAVFLLPAAGAGIAADGVAPLNRAGRDIAAESKKSVLRPALVASAAQMIDFIGPIG